MEGSQVYRSSEYKSMLCAKSCDFVDVPSRMAPIVPQPTPQELHLFQLAWIELASSRNNRKVQRQMRQEFPPSKKQQQQQQKGLMHKLQKSEMTSEPVKEPVQVTDSVKRILSSPLFVDQRRKVTHSDKRVSTVFTSHLLNRKKLAEMANNPIVSPDIQIIIQLPFSSFDLIVDGLYQTGIGGLHEENLSEYKIGLIINATYEMPLLVLSNILSVRVPIEDSAVDDMLIYLDDTSDLIEAFRLKKSSTLVHCMAGVSRSSTITLAYMIKYTKMNLYESFVHLRQTRLPIHPNINFIRQLLIYEQLLRGEQSFHLVRNQIGQTMIVVPDFYQQQFPELYETEVRRQCREAENWSLH